MAKETIPMGQGAVPKGSLTSPLPVNKRRGQKADTLATSNPPAKGLPKPIK